MDLISLLTPVISRMPPQAAKLGDTPSGSGLPYGDDWTQSTLANILKLAVEMEKSAIAKSIRTDLLEIKELYERPPSETETTISIMAPGATSFFLLQTSLLAPSDINSIFSNASNLEFMRGLVLGIFRSTQGFQEVLSPLQLLRIADASIISILDHLAPHIITDTIAQAGNILGPNINMDDEVLALFAALIQLEQTMALIASDTIRGLAAGVLRERPEEAFLPQEAKEMLITGLSALIELALLRLALTNIAVLIGDREPLVTVLDTIFDRLREEPDVRWEELVRPLEQPIQQQLTAAVTKYFRDRITEEEQEAFVQRILTQLFGPTLIAFRPAPVPPPREGEAPPPVGIVPPAPPPATAPPVPPPTEGEEPITPPVVAGEEAVQQESIILRSALETFFDRFDAIVKVIENIDKKTAERAEKNFREAPIINFTEKLASWFIRMLLPVFRFEHTPGGITYRSDDKDPNLPPPDMMFRV